MSIRQAILGLVLALGLWGCGNSGNSDKLTPLEPPPTKGYTMMVFSTPWCTTCETLLPELDKRVNTEIAGEQRAKLNVVLYVVTSTKPSQAPTAEIAKQYQSKLGLSFPAQPDLGKRAMYRKYYGEDHVVVPGIVVLGPTLASPKIYEPGSFIPEEVVTFLKANIK